MRKPFAPILVGAMLLSGCAATPSTPIESLRAIAASRSPTPIPSTGAVRQPTTSAERPATPSPAAGIQSRLPVRGSGRGLGTEIRIAPGPDGRLWLSIPREKGVLLALIDNAGKPSPGWPILLPDVDGCDRLLPVDDATVRIVCSVPPAADGSVNGVVRAFAFDANAQSMPSWPVDVADGDLGRMIGHDLVLLSNPLRQVGGEAGQQWPIAVVVIGADGTRRTGVEVPFTCCDSNWTIGPDGSAYGLTRRWESADSVRTDVLGFDLDGPRSGWPITLGGNASDLAFGPPGSIYTIVESPDASTDEMVVLDRDGGTRWSTSTDQSIVSTSASNRAGYAYPGEPFVAADGTAFIVSTRNGTTVQSLDPSGRSLPGWPYRSKLGMEWTGYCGPGETGCGSWRTSPVVGPNNVLYVLHAAGTRSTGASLVAIGSNGKVRDGWPVTLKRAGSMFWSVAVAPYGGVWALAVEPEVDDFSATILSLAEDSTVLWSTTILEP